jgi:hypothetical protein
MTKQTINTLMTIFTIGLGLWLAIFSKHHARKTAEFYHRLLNITYNVKGYQVAFLLGGIVFIMFGLLILFGIVRFK